MRHSPYAERRTKMQPFVFHWEPLLLESNSDADTLVFSTYLWWRQGPAKMLWSTDENGVCDELDGMGAMQLVREAWADWVASKVYLIRSREWEPGTEGNCYQQRTPINTEVYWESGSDLPTMQIVDTALSRAVGKHKGAHSKYQGLQVGTNACNLNN